MTLGQIEILLDALQRHRRREDRRWLMLLRASQAVQEDFERILDDLDG